MLILQNFRFFVSSRILSPILTSFLNKEENYRIYKNKFGHKALIRPRSFDLFVFLEQDYTGEYDDALVPEGGIVVELGGHIGSSALAQCALVGDKGHLYSIEADPANYVLLEKNLQRNGFKNYSVFNKAIIGSEEVSSIDIQISKLNTGAHSLYPLGEDCAQRLSVEAETLESFMKENIIEKIDLLHMDIEGAEFDVLLNLKPETFEKIDLMVFEYHTKPDTGFDRTDLVSRLEKYGFECKETKPWYTKWISQTTGIITARKKP